VVVIDERAVEIEQIRGVVGKWAADWDTLDSE
jgi:hypothetical protein